MSYSELGLAELPIAAETQQCLVSKCASGVGTRAPLDAENRIATDTGWRQFADRVPSRTGLMGVGFPLNVVVLSAS
jgi:hypothetical protein